MIRALTILFLFTSSAIAAEPAAKPNIVFILADDLGYGDVSCFGQSKYQSPNIDRLAKGGMKFTQFYAGSTVCAPSRCSLMTGYHCGHALILIEITEIGIEAFLHRRARRVLFAESPFSKEPRSIARSFQDFRHGAIVRPKILPTISTNQRMAAMVTRH